MFQQVISLPSHASSQQGKEKVMRHDFMVGKYTAKGQCVKCVYDLFLAVWLCGCGQCVECVYDLFLAVWLCGCVVGSCKQYDSGVIFNTFSTHRSFLLILNI